MSARSIADIQRRQADFIIQDAEDTDHPLLLEQVHVSKQIYNESSPIMLMLDVFPILCQCPLHRSPKYHSGDFSYEQ